jgi:hypothetical protein
MRALRRAAVLAVCFTVGAAVVASPDVLAEPARPGVANSVAGARPGQTVAKDAQGRTLVYVEGQQDSALRAAVAKAGGVVDGTTAGRVKAAVPSDKLDVVAAQPGVKEVRLPERAVPMSVTSEGVGLSKADLWIQGGKRGAGVKVGIIDVGFAGVADAQAGGELPTGSHLTVDNSNCVDGSLKSPHGTAVAEIVHDMAPDADLYLACIEDTVGFSAAETWLRQQGVQVITAAVGFLSPTGGRGDGTGPADSPADVVRRSRQAGILWSVAAGNQARLHYAGKATDANGDSWVEFNGATQNNGFPLASGDSATVGIRWDAWPATNEDLDLYVMAQSHPPAGPNDPDLRGVSNRSQKDTQSGLSPTEEVTFANTGSPAITRTFWVYVKNNSARFTTPFDLFVSGPSGQLQTYTEAGSVTEPATSPYAMAVGASAAGSSAIENFSGRGPTVDGRQKPDIVGFDQVSTSSVGTFQGTSAAAAHVAGAAALLKSANPQLDAAQIEAALRARTSPKKSDNTWGSGTLNLGTPQPVTVTGSGFTVLPAQSRIHDEAYTAGQVKVLPFPSVPGDTTAVAITVSARSDADTIIDVTPGDPAASGSTATGLQVRGGNTFTSATFFAPLGPDRSVRIRSRGGNAWVAVDFLGYFSPSQSTDTYFAKPVPQRVLDSRGFVGSPRSAPLEAAQVQDVPIRGVAGVPAGATSVLVNLTAFESTTDSFVLAYGGNNPGTTTVAVSQADRRSNIAIVPIGDDGKIHVVNNTDDGQVGAALDVLGWFGPGAGARYVTLPEATRIADTATGTGLPKAPVGKGQSAQFQVAGLAGVSSTATAAALVVTGTDNMEGTDLTVRPAESAWSPVTDISTRKLEPSASTVLVPLGDSGKVNVRSDRGRTRVSADEPGYLSAFDGRDESDLEGWLTAGTKPLRTDGCELVTDSGKDVNWYVTHTFNNDYTVKLDFKSTTDNSDSGVYVLMPNPGDDPDVPGTRGLEVNIGPRNATPLLQTGAITGFSAPATTTPVKPAGEWNTFEISVKWNTVTVKVNGVQVNQYTTPDSARWNRVSYIGLQNNGTNDQVRFRNIRIRRDTPITSGPMLGVNSRCLEVKNGDPRQPVVSMQQCQGGFAQVWTSTGDGTLEMGAHCLTVQDSGSGNGNPVILADCAGNDSQQWIVRQDGRVVNINSGRCLTPKSGNVGAQLQIADCGPARSDQIWHIPDQHGTTGQVAGPGGRCLNLTDGDPVANQARLWDCYRGASEVWVMPGDGTLRGGGKCLNLSGSNTADGSPVALLECNGSQAQQWIPQADGTLVNPLSSRCLTAASTDNAALLKITNCAAGKLQIWRLTAWLLWRGPVVGVGGKCVDVDGNDPNATRLWDCYGPVNQLWVGTQTGTFVAFDKCMDIDGADNLSLVVVAECDEAGDQQWVARHDGTIVDVAVNKCLDDDSGDTDNGATLWIYDCYRPAWQRWSTPVSVS